LNREAARDGDDDCDKASFENMGETVVVTPPTRRFLACLSACGIAASVLVYIESFSGATIDNNWRWEILLGIGVFAVSIPLHILEYPSSQKWNFYWKKYAQCMPSWVVPCDKLFWLIAIAQGVWFLIHSGGGAPTIMDGQYVLDSRGRVLKVLTQSEYLALKAEEIRMLAALMIACYFGPMMYWWFRRNPQQGNESVRPIK
jgi:hypothetical protein